MRIIFIQKFAHFLFSATANWTFGWGMKQRGGEFRTVGWIGTSRGHFKCRAGELGGGPEREREGEMREEFV